jgi:hypothetical protein
MKKILLSFIVLCSIFGITGCSTKEISNQDAKEIISESSGYQKFKKNILINYAVDDTSITATGDIAFDTKENKINGNIKLNINNNVVELKLYEINKNLFLKYNDSYFKINYSLIDLLKNIKQKEIEDVNYINIHSKDEKIMYYQSSIKIDDNINALLKQMGSILSFNNSENIKDIKSISIRNGIKDNYCYKTEINLAPILEHNFIKDTSVIGVASYESTLYDFKEDVVVPNIEEYTEIINVKDIFNDLGGSENENN